MSFFLIWMNFNGKDIISIKDFSKDIINYILDYAQDMVPYAKGDKYKDILKGKVLSSLFFEPSTRTRLSFESSMNRLGGKVIGFSDPSATSQKKGESLADTIKMADSYSDVIVIRHSQEGAARLAAEFADVPVINAGDGAGQHPTQCLLDLFTIKSEKNKIGNNKIALLGDLKYGRTVHSLSVLLSNFDVNVYFISPKELKMRNRETEYLRTQGSKFKEMTDYRKVLDLLDVLYMTRIQKERFVDLEEYERIKNFYVFNREDLNVTKDNFKLMHPLPRITEISPKVDPSEKTIYFKQTKYGLHLRMALLAELLKD